MLTSINWYPGHIASSLKEVKSLLKKVDYVIELRDSRAPSACANNITKDVLSNKKVLILTKCDLADPILNKKWCDSLRKSYDSCFCLNLKEANNKFVLKLLQAKQNIKNKTLKVIVLGVPNSGKSTLVNNIINRKVAQVKNMPGATRKMQWYQILPKIYLLDTPGILDFIKNRKYSDNVKLNLALIGSIKVKQYEKEEMVIYLLNILKEKYAYYLEKFLSIDNNSIKNSTILDLIHFYRYKNNIFSKDNQIIENNVCDKIVNNFNDGKIGRITLEEPPF